MVVLAVLVAGFVLVVGGDREIDGRASGVLADEWSTLSDPASGLSYQIPPSRWRTNPDVGTAGSVALTQGAELTAYTCGTPVERLLRGVLGSGSAPRSGTASDMATLADSVAVAAANQYYHDSGAPVVALDPPTRLTRTSHGTTLDGVLVRAVASQHADHCLASRGEVLVFVLRFGDHDGVLVVNGDLAGGPADPAPVTDTELRAIVGTARPTS